MYFKGKNIEKQVTLKGYLFPGDRKLYRQSGKSILLYKRKMDQTMIWCQFTLSPNQFIEHMNYYILLRK